MENQTGSIQRFKREYSTLFFRDGKRQIDFVLAYDNLGSGNAIKERFFFEESLIAEGLELEIENENESVNEKVNFVKIHGPWKIMAKYAEHLSVKMPLRQTEMTMSKCSDFPFPPKYVFSSRRQHILMKILNMPIEGNILNYYYFASKKICYNPNLIPDPPRYFSVPFHQQCENLFLVHHEDGCLSRSQRSHIVWEILDHTKYNSNGCVKGIQTLLQNGVYTAAYPLHDGHCGKGVFKPGKEICNDRRVLVSEWARIGCLFKMQPLNLVRSYFGDEIGFFFAWIAFHVKMLIIPSIIGIFVIFYGLASMNPDVASAEICNIHDIGNETMCPLCDTYCPYWKLINYCSESRIIQLLDNNAAFLFSFVVTIWAFAFVKMWKRQEATHAWFWDLSDDPLHQEIFRRKCDNLQCNFSVNQPRRNFDITSTGCLKAHHRRKISSILFWVILLLDCIVGVVIYHLSVTASLNFSVANDVSYISPGMITILAPIVNIIAITILEKLYMVIALWLVEFEMPRTKWNFENNLIFKAFPLQFVNMFSSLAYIAFFKGKFTSDPKTGYSFLGFTQNECSLDNCFLELTKHLIIFVIFRHVISYLGFLYREVYNWLWKNNKFRRFPDLNKKLKAAPRWEQDYVLHDYDYKTMFYNEYKELAMQFAFSTLFVISFPLAPLFILIFNFFKLRLIASKYIRRFRLPVAFKTPNIDAWTTLLYGIAILSVFTNAFFISFTSRYVPSEVYKLKYSCDYGSVFGYVNFTLSVFNVSEFDESSKPLFPGLENVTSCRYPCTTPAVCDCLPEFLTVFCYRLILVIGFQCIVFGIGALICYCIYDEPRHIHKKKLQDLRLARSALVEFMTFLRNNTQHLNAVHPTLSTEDDNFF